MRNIFQTVRMKGPSYNKFDLSHERKTALNMANLVPMFVADILPGDKFRVSSEIMMRMVPMLAPIMHRVDVYTHYFFVPDRIVWSEFEDFITGGPDGDLAPVAPFVSTADIGGLGSAGSLWDHLGLPNINGVGDPQNVSVLPFRAYQLIYDEYYRDQNLTDPIGCAKTSGDQVAEIAKLLTLRTRCWEKDYFTSALPWAQRGAAAGVSISDDPLAATSLYRAGAGGAPFTVTGNLGVIGATSLTSSDSAGESGTVHVGAQGHYVDINDLRRSMRLQEWLEANARGGARYVEQMLSHFKVVSSDARLQRPEYLGGGKAAMRVSEVLSTVNFEGMAENVPQGNMAGHGIAVGKSNGFSRRFEEHGYVIGILSVLPRTAYQQGIHRHWTRFDKFDYAWPELAHIGEQEVLEKELFFDGVNTTVPGANTFGYQSRYSEYKYGCTTVHGSFRDTLDFWHMGRIFGDGPVLNTAFVQADPTTRIFPVDEGSHLLSHIYNRVDAIRPLPYFGTPTL